MAGHDRQTAAGKKFFKEIEELKKLQVRVGYQQGAAQSEDGVDLLDIAMWNELGTSNSPSRPFMRNSVDMNKAVVNNFCKAQLKSIANGGTAEKVLNAVGGMQKGLVQDTISKSKSWAEPNAPSTIRKKSKGKKAGDQPLVDSGRMEQSVDYVIVPKGGG